MNRELVAISQSQIAFMLVVMRIAAVGVGGRNFRIERDRLSVIGDGAVEIALVLIRVAAVGVGDSAIIRALSA